MTFEQLKQGVYFQLVYGNVIYQKKDDNIGEPVGNDGFLPRRFNPDDEVRIVIN